MRLGVQVKNESDVTVQFQPHDFPAIYMLQKHPLWILTGKSINKYLPVDYEGTSINPHLTSIYVYYIARRIVPNYLFNPMMEKLIGKAAISEVNESERVSLKQLFNGSYSSGLIDWNNLFSKEIRITKSDASNYSWRGAAIAERFLINKHDLNTLTSYYISHLTKNRKTKNAYDSVENYLYYAVHLVKGLPRGEVQNGHLRYLLSLLPQDFYEEHKRILPISEINKVVQTQHGSMSDFAQYDFEDAILPWPRLLLALLKEYTPEQIVSILNTGVKDITVLEALRELGFTSVEEIIEQNRTIPTEWKTQLATVIQETYTSDTIERYRYNLRRYRR